MNTVISRNELINRIEELLKSASWKVVENYRKQSVRVVKGKQIGKIV